jgi:hypothetical protein
MCSHCHLLWASMNTLLHIVDHANKCFEANCSVWRDVRSSTNDLLTCRDLERFAALSNEGYDAVEGEDYLCKNWQFSFLGCPTYIRIRNGVEGHEEDKESDYVGSNDESWGGSIKSTGGREYFLMYHQWIAYFEWLQFHPEEAARYRQFKVSVYASFLYCLVLIIWLIRNVCSFITFIWWIIIGDQGSH